jgi:YHS domain-containing protein
MKNTTRIAFAALILAAAGLTACNNDKTAATDSKMEAKSTAPINKMCAINPSEEANAKVTSTCDGKTVAFCCAGCKGKFDKMTHQQQEAVVAKAK